MGQISIAGLGSGLDVQSIIDALVQAERAPKQNSLDRQEADAQVKLTGIGSLSSALDELRSSALDLSLSSSFNKRQVSISDNTFFTASANSSSTPGSFDVEIQSLAKGTESKSQIFTSGASTTFGSGGTLTFTAGTSTFNVTVSSTDTLSDIRDNINAATSNFGVSVNLLNNVSNGIDTGSILTFASSTTGTANNLAVTFSGDASLADLSTGLTETQTAADGSILIDGLTATSTNNTYTDFVQGVTITALKENTPTNTEQLDISLDTASTKSLITGFVEAYNTYVDVIKQLTIADPEQPGILVGDATVRQVDSQVRNLFSSSVNGITTEFNSISSIGLTTTREGKIEIDSTKLDSAISNSFDQLDELFSGTNGFATQLKSLIDNYTGSGGILPSREESINQQLDRISENRIDLDYRIQLLQTRLVDQFSAMDTIVAQFNSTSAYLSQQLANLPGFSNSSKSNK